MRGDELHRRVSADTVPSPPPSNPAKNIATTEIASAISQGFEMIRLAPSIATLGLYDQRKTRLFQTTRKELVQIRSERKAREKQELAEAAEFRKHDLLTILPGEKHGTQVKMALFVL